MLLKLIKTNNYFGQHDFVLENVTNIDDTISILEDIKWTKKPSIHIDDNEIQIHCFTNYDKVKLEGVFTDG